MNTFISSLFTWAVAEIFLTFGVWAVSLALRNARLSAFDRYRFLKFSFLAVPWIPFLSVSRFFRGSRTVGLNSTGAIGHPTFERVSQLHFPAAHFDGFAYLVGAVYLFFLLRGLVRMFLSHVKLNLVANEGELALVHGKFSLVIHDLSVPPAAIGILRPRILVPRKVASSVTPHEMEMILRHEETHIQRRDYLFNLLVGLVQTVLIFSPFSHLIAKRFRVEMELSCDATVLSDGRFAPKDYGNLLLALLARISPRPDLAYSGLFVADSFINQRIQSMKNINTKSRPAVVLGLLLTMAGGGAFASSVLRPSSQSLSKSQESIAGKELRLEIKIYLDTEDGVGEVGTNGILGLNYEETGEILLGGKKVEIKPTRLSGNSEMVFNVFSTNGDQVHHSVVPFNGEALLSAKLDYAQTGISKAELKVKQLP